MIIGLTVYGHQQSTVNTYNKCLCVRARACDLHQTVTISNRKISDHKQTVTRVLRSKNYKYFQRKTPLGCADKPIKLKGGFGGFTA